MQLDFFGRVDKVGDAESFMQMRLYLAVIAKAMRNPLRLVPSLNWYCDSFIVAWLRYIQGTTRV